MKESNYCSLEVSKKLVDAGININTENHWCHWDNGEWTLGNEIIETPREFIPAPTFTEIWVELPKEYNECVLCLMARDVGVEIGYYSYNDESMFYAFDSSNITESVDNTPIVQCLYKIAEDDEWMTG